MRYNRKFLTARAAMAFKDCGLNTGPAYVDGKAQVGATYIAKSSLSGWTVEQIANPEGGVRQLSGWCNAFTASELVAFLDGMMLGAELAKKDQAK